MARRIPHYHNDRRGFLFLYDYTQSNSFGIKTMGIIYNRPRQKRIRQYLRNTASDAERLLWSSLKGSQLSGYKFRRQQGIGQYVVDFYCPSKKVAIEIDGATHWTKVEQQRDHERQCSIEALGIRVLRFTNEDVYTNKVGIMDMILAVLENQEND
jgi:very-short-patch-repair endonuclease